MSKSMSTRSRWCWWSWEPELSSASVLLSLMPSDFLDSVPHEVLVSAASPPHRVCIIRGIQFIFVECVKGRNFGAGVSQPSLSIGEWEECPERCAQDSIHSTNIYPVPAARWALGAVMSRTRHGPFPPRTYPLA